MYLKAIDQCFLAEHLDDKLPTPEEIQEMVDGGMVCKSTPERVFMNKINFAQI